MIYVNPKSNEKIKRANRGGGFATYKKKLRNTDRVCAFDSLQSQILSLRLCRKAR